jgi:2',3'-cyclic-nucleotide 2'-phosphodiesterase/3'-nucleotidase
MRDYFTPYLIKELDGVRLGILGLTTPNIPNWETPENYAGLEFLDTVDVARRYVSHLREEEKVDAVIVLTHQALERDLATGASNQTEHENQVYRLITQVPGIDVVLMGHAHQKRPPQEVEGVVVCEPGPWGRDLCRVDLFFETDASGSIRLARWSGDLLSTKDVEPDREVLESAKVYHEQTMGYIGSIIGEAVGPISADRARFRDTPIMDLLQQMMLEKSGAQLSLAALLPYSFDGIPAGPVTVQQIFSFYIYDNTLVVVELTGKQVKEILEHSARYYHRAGWDADRGRLILDINPEVRPYNFDILAGAHYRIDPSRPVGQRIRDLTYQGKPMDLDARFTLVTTNYRTAGGGGFPALKEAKVVWRSSEEVRNLLIDHIREQGRIRPFCDYNWIVAPDVSPSVR